jgi:hypothetical protein
MEDNSKIIYHVFRKNVDGIYLLDKRNDVIYTDTIYKDAEEIFWKRVNNKVNPNETYVLFAEIPGRRYLQIMLER